MRTAVAVAVLALGTTWSLGARAQLAPPPPMQQPPPGSSWGQPQQPAYGQPVQPGYGQPAQPGWGQPYNPQQPGYGQPPSATQQQLDAAAQAKSFRGLEIGYLNAEAGGSFASFSRSEGGGMFGAGGGLRFVTWTLGLRARVHLLSDNVTMVQALVEAGFHLPVGAWDPYVHIHGGYLNLHLNEDGAGAGSKSGGTFGGALGADYYFTALVSTGLDASFDGLFVGGGGFGLSGSLHLGLHFDL
jgi:hypothetical protein